MSDNPKKNLSFLERQRLLKERFSQKNQSLAFDPLKPYPLSFIQEGVYFHEKLCQSPYSYINSVAFLIKGKIDASKFENVCKQFIDETPLWSINLTCSENLVFQSLSKQSNLNFKYISFDENKTVDYCINDAKKSVLPPNQLYQFLLYKNELNSHVFIIHCHHLVSDGWSFNLILERLSELYNQFESIDSKPDYRFFPYAEKSRLKKYDQEISYWKSVLTKPLNYLNLLPYKNQLLVSNNNETQRYYLDEHHSSRFDLFSKNNQLTVYMFYYAAFLLVLHMYTGNDRLIIGTTSANRKPEEYKVIGMFANILPLLIDIKHEMTCNDLLQGCKKVILDMLKHQDIPYSSLIRELSLNHTNQQFPLFDILYVCQNASIKGLELSNLNCTRIPFTKSVTEFGLSLEIWKDKNTYVFECHYKKDYYPKSFVNNLLSNIHKAALFLSGETNACINQFQITQKLFTQSFKSFENQDLISFFNQQVITFPNHIAVSDETGCYSYLDLDNASNNLAQQLQAKGIKKYQRIGIFHERSFQFIVAILAIIKCRCSYVPLDSCYPNNRLSFIIKHSKLTACLSNKSLKFESDVLIDFNYSIIDSYALYLTSCESTVLSKNISELYVIYTSGSTGNPKGVSISQQNLLSLLNACGTCFEFSSKDRFVLFHSPSFDVSVFEIFACLYNGACLHIPPLSTCLNPSLFAQYCCLNQITVLSQTPSYYYQLQPFILDSANSIEFRYIIFAGEKLSFSQIKQSLFSSLSSKCSFINMYGITEVTIHATFYKIKRADAFRKESIIGKSLDNISIEILDQFLRPLPPYVVGEFYLSGTGVSNGYINDSPDLNKAFIKNTQIKGTLYKSGDYGYIDKDENLVYLHRKDKQIQLRGFRIELEEINSVLSKHPNISSSYLISHKSQKNNSLSLLCFYITINSKPLANKELEAFVLENLPRYMCPSQFVHIKKYPLTGSSKIDEIALLKLQKNTLMNTQENLKLTIEESQLKKIWTECLGHDSFTIDDSFFLIGGDSLKAMSVLMKSNTYFKSNKDLAYFFQNPTISSFLASSSKSNVFETPDFSKDEKLNLDFTKQTIQITQVKYPSFLTGATGFIGSHILNQYLTENSHDIYCFIRAKSNTEAISRLKNSLLTYNLWQDSFKDRIKIVTGDLTSPQCGMATQDWQTLPNIISDIIHCASSTNFNLSYHHLKQSNIDSCKHLLQLACQKYFIPFNYISTLSVFMHLELEKSTYFKEDLDISNLPDPFYGYAQSKRIAESYIFQAHQKGLPIRIIRPGNISWSTASKISNSSSLLSSFLKMIMQGFPLPKSNPYFPLFPVDIFSKYLLKIVFNPNTINTAYHFTNPSLLKLSDYVEILSSLTNYKPYYLNDEKWIETLSFKQHPLFYFKSFLSKRFVNSDMNLLKYYSLQASHQFGIENTLKLFPNLIHELASSKKLFYDFIYQYHVQKTFN